MWKYLRNTSYNAIEQWKSVASLVSQGGFSLLSSPQPIAIEMEMQVTESKKYIWKYLRNTYWRGKSQGGISLPNIPQPIAIEMEMQSGP